MKCTYRCTGDTGETDVPRGQGASKVGRARHADRQGARSASCASEKGVGFTRRMRVAPRKRVMRHCWRGPIGVWQARIPSRRGLPARFRLPPAPGCSSTTERGPLAVVGARFKLPPAPWGLTGSHGNLTAGSRPTYLMVWRRARIPSRRGLPARFGLPPAPGCSSTTERGPLAVVGARFELPPAPWGLTGSHGNLTASSVGAARHLSGRRVTRWRGASPVGAARHPSARRVTR